MCLRPSDTVNGQRCPCGSDLVPVKGSDSDWYKNILKTPTIRLAAQAAQLNATASPTSDAANVEQVLDRFRAKYGARDVEAYYPKQDVAVEVPLA